MSVRPCPHCRNSAPRLLDHSSADAFVWYFRCEACGHVFTVGRDKPDAPTRTVVAGRGDPERA